MHTCSHKLIHISVHMYIHTPEMGERQSYVRTRAHSNTHRCTHVYTHPPSHMHTNTHVYKHTKHTHIRAPAFFEDTHTHTRTHTDSLVHTYVHTDEIADMVNMVNVTLEPAFGICYARHTLHQRAARQYGTLYEPTCTHTHTFS